MTRGPETSVAGLRARAFTVPTETPEADGTLAWRSTTLVTAEVEAGGMTGVGYTYSDASAARLIRGVLAETIVGRDAFDIPAAWHAMRRQVRNIGADGIAATAISAVDTALWDLKARLLALPLGRLLGHIRSSVPIYGSGGFVTDSDERMIEQLGVWVERDGCPWVKIKIGAEPESNARRIALARKTISERGLFVDANGAFTPKRAIAVAGILETQNVEWFEEPVSSDDLSGLCLVRERTAMEVAAGEYGYTLDHFRRMIDAGAVDVLQADATRCMGFTGFLKVAALCDAHHLDLSGHCAPALHLGIALSVPRLRHLEWFQDHVRIENLLFDGAPVPNAGAIAPDATRPGLGLALKEADAARFEVAA